MVASVDDPDPRQLTWQVAVPPGRQPS